MIAQMKRTTSRLTHRLHHATVAVTSAIKTKITGLWRQHPDRIDTNPDYATAIGAAAAAITKLFTDEPTYLAVVAAIAGLYVAIHHATRRDTRRHHTSAWEPRQPSWEDRWDDTPGWP